MVLYSFLYDVFFDFRCFANVLVYTISAKYVFMTK